MHVTTVDLAAFVLVLLRGSLHLLASNTLCGALYEPDSLSLSHTTRHSILENGRIESSLLRFGGQMSR
eukprot:m.295535 g.295535  ORF g.295535 m.295535 type:complete len:68 (-) comp15855_c0_seq4:2929-3132(-)